MPTIRIPTSLRSYTGGQGELALEGATVSAVMRDLAIKYPALEPHLFSQDGILRPFVNLYLGEENIKDLQGLHTKLKQDDRLLLIPSIAGG